MAKRSNNDFDWFEDELLAVEKDRGGNPAADWGRTMYDDEDDFMDDNRYVAANSRRRARQPSSRRGYAACEAELQRGIFGLSVVAILEIAAIIGILGWWLQWFT